jgi:hypothetical protein
MYTSRLEKFGIDQLFAGRRDPWKSHGGGGCHFLVPKCGALLTGMGTRN